MKKLLWWFVCSVGVVGLGYVEFLVWRVAHPGAPWWAFFFTS